MSKVFNEVYGTYFNVVARILKEAVQQKLTPQRLQKIVYEDGYGESLLELLPALQEGKWQLLTSELRTPVKNVPQMPLTILQKQWLKTILLDKRIQLFLEPTELEQLAAGLTNVEPLYKPEDCVFYDRYIDGDDFTNAGYRNNFKAILQGIKEKRYVSISYRNNKQKISIWEDMVPCSLEYSVKDDKFRLLCIEGKRYIFLNLGKMISVEVGEAYDAKTIAKAKVEPQKKVVLELIDERKTLERALIQFSDLAKETDRLDDNRYRLTIYYDKCDEKELVYRILSFGPTIRVLEPESFISLIRVILKEQLACRNVI